MSQILNVNYVRDARDYFLHVHKNNQSLKGRTQNNDED